MSDISASGSRPSPEVSGDSSIGVSTVLMSARHRMRPLGSGAGVRAADLVAAVAALFEVDFLFERALQIVRGALELGQPLADRAPELGELAGAEDEQGDHHDHQELRSADRAEHQASVFACEGATDGQHHAAMIRPRPPCRQRPLARIPQRVTAARAQRPTLTALRLIRALDVLHEYDCAPDPRAPCLRRPLHSLAPPQMATNSWDRTLVATSLERSLDRLARGSLAEQQHEQEAGLGAGEVVGEDHTAAPQCRAAAVVSVHGGGTAAEAACRHDDGDCRRSVLDGFRQPRRDISSSHAFDDEARGPRGQAGGDVASVCTGNGLDEIDVRFDRAAVEGRQGRAGRCAEEDHVAAIDDAEGAALRAAEGVVRLGVHLHHLGGGVNGIGHDHHRAAAGRGW